MYVHPESKNFDFEKVGIKGKIFPLQQLTDKTQFVLVETEYGHETTIRENKCDFCYYILEGSGYFLIESQKYPCKAGDLVVIPAGKRFTYKGKFRILLNVTPPWTEDQEDTLEGEG